jgi:peptidyl-prolyl cis-trans isomerase D
MLSVLKKKDVSKKILLVTIALMVPGFLFWGTDIFNGPKKSGPVSVGKIDEKDVPIEEFRASRAAVRTLATLNYLNDPKTLEPLLKDKALMARLAWERLVTLREARWRGIKVSDPEVISQIRSHPAFSRDSKFDEKIYKYFLRNVLGIEPRVFEEIVREGLEAEKLNDIIAKDIKLSDDEVELQYKRENEKFGIAYIIVSAADIKEKVTIDEAEERDYYEKHKVEFALSPKGNNASSAEPAYFEDVRDDIRKFLTTQKESTFVFAKARDIHSRIKKSMEEDKASFEKAAGECGFKVVRTPLFSPSDKIEYIGQGYLIAQEAEKLKTGEMSDPLTTKGGTMIFALKDIQPIDPEKFKEEKTEFSKKLLKAKKDIVLQKWVWENELRATINTDLATIE